MLDMDVRFADPIGFDPFLKQITDTSSPITDDPLGDRVEQVRDAFQRGEIDEETYEEMMLSIGEASGEAGV